MIRKNSIRLVIVGVTTLMVCLSSDALAQCSRGGGGERAVSGNTSGINSILPISASSLNSNYPSANGLMARQYQQAAQLQNQLYMLAYQNAQRQRLARIAYQQRVRPTRLARAEANRAARASRIAARISDRNRASEIESNGQYSLASTTVNSNVFVR